jgi:hypothetical protein
MSQTRTVTATPFLFLQAVRIYFSDTADQGRFSMIHIPGISNGTVPLHE